MAGGGGRSKSRSSRSSSSHAVGGKSKAGEGSATGGRDECDLRFVSSLNGIQKTVLDTTKVGDALQVEIRRVGAYDSVVCLRSGNVLGSLAAFEGLATLIKCLKDGNQYEAEIVAKTSGTCRVEVRSI